jgi:alkylation response protein AidB-like acyl-CoA dehydrogenase
MMLGVALPWFQVGSASVSLGIGESAFAGAVKHTSTARLEHLGESLASAVPGIRARLARMKLTLDSASAFLEQTLGAIEADSPSAMLSVLGVKAVAGEAALEVTDEAMRACGGAAFGRQLSIERNFRDARAASVMAPTTDVLCDFIGKAVAGIPLF